MPGVKIATCQFCGTKAALVLRGKERHELACSSCGAPLHDMKMFPKQPDPSLDRPRRQSHGPVDSHHRAMSRKDDRYRKKPKKSKSFASRFLSEVFDVVEDIFD